VVYRRFGKRLFDLALTALALPVLLPVMAVVAALVRVKLGTPVLFQQERPGLGGRPFTILKFRTMTDARDADGNLLPDADRLTGFGRLLRALSLDELPELINVVRGEMSLVGPRPLLTRYLGRYSPEQRRRHEVLPGLTGWAQVGGRNALGWDERFARDVWYVDNLSFGRDLKILLMTLLLVVRREGISAEGHATMTEFLGPGRRDDPSHDATPGDPPRGDRFRGSCDLDRVPQAGRR
jgi:lipopolysaccharide/colanic/teichoic acid biosynthesis glycosyltransferase